MNSLRRHGTRLISISLLEPPFSRNGGVVVRLGRNKNNWNLQLGPSCNIQLNHLRRKCSFAPFDRIRPLKKPFSRPIGSNCLLLLLSKARLNCNQIGIAQMSSSSSSNKDYESNLRLKFKPRECSFKTPYGKLAGLEWGNPEAAQKMLCIHGWLDNAGSFERLVPFILDHKDNANRYHIVSMDQPGVGHSSHRPPGGDYTMFSIVMEMRRITQQLKWDKVTLLAHSLGSHLSFLYSCVYPNQVETMISIDLAHPITRQTNNWNLTIANSIDDHFKCEYTHDDDPTTNIRVPVYSEVDAIKRLMVGHSNSLTRESAEVLLKRGAKKQSWGYTFNRDIRLRHFSLEFRPDDDHMLQYLSEPFRPNLFLIRANQSPYHRPEEVRLKYYELFKRNCPTFKDITMDGTHHLHLNTPELVATEINKFLDDVQMAEGRRNSKSNL